MLSTSQTPFYLFLTGIPWDGYRLPIICRDTEIQGFLIMGSHILRNSNDFLLKSAWLQNICSFCYSVFPFKHKTIFWNIKQSDDERVLSKKHQNIWQIADIVYLVNWLGSLFHKISHLVVFWPLQWNWVNWGCQSWSVNLDQKGYKTAHIELVIQPQTLSFPLAIGLPDATNFQLERLKGWIFSGCPLYLWFVQP